MTKNKPLSQKKMPTDKASKPPATTAVHLSDKDGEHHAVGIWNLRVLIVPDGRFWFAQGFEIDYGVQGDSVADAKKKFQQGLRSTIHHNLRIFGTIDNLMKVAPNAQWLDLWKTAHAQQKRYSQISMHDVMAQRSNALPFENIEYTEVCAAA